jgi:transposase
MTASVPYLSIVGWVRNDGYMEGYIERVQRALRLLISQLDRHKVPTEIVIVEWNPPPDRPLFVDLVGDCRGEGYVTVRFVVVDGCHHRSLIGSQFKGMHVINAANVGMRRARGRFLVPKGMDTFLTDSVIAQIARAQLRDDEFYRCDRYDVKVETADWDQLTDGQLLERMSESIVNHHDRIVQRPEWAMRDLHTNACGDFMLMAARRWHEIRGYPDDPTVLCFDSDSIALHAVAAHGVREVCWPDDCRVYKIVHGNIFILRASEEWKTWQKRLDDFVTKYFSPGLRIKLRMLLDYPHRRIRGLETILGPSIERNFVMKAQRYAHNDTSLLTNTEDWGLANEPLAERIIVRGDWDVEQKSLAG